MDSSPPNIMPTLLGSNAIDPPKEVAPIFTHCEICDRRLMTKDLPAHRNGKKHKGNEMASSEWKKRSKPEHMENGVKDGHGKDKPYDNSAFIASFAKYSNRQCHQCGRIGHIGFECPILPLPIPYDRIRCYKCDITGHAPQNCPFPAGPICFTCRAVGHVSSNCPMNRISGPGDRICHRCGQRGHISRDCTNKAVKVAHPPGDPGAIQCFHCGRYGHAKFRCPELNNDGGDSLATTYGGDQDKKKASTDSDEWDIPTRKPITWASLANANIDHSIIAAVAAAAATATTTTGTTGPNADWIANIDGDVNQDSEWPVVGDLAAPKRKKQ